MSGVSRRRFMEAAAGAVASLVPLHASPKRSVARAASTDGLAFDCALLDLQERCTLPESCAGYEAALRDSSLHYAKLLPSRLPRCRTMIVPGCVTIQPEVAHKVGELLEGGSLILLESGAGFAVQEEFNAHQKFLQAHFNLQVGHPMSLWEGTGSRRRVPYVDYVWPTRTKIRDFSGVVPLSKPTGRLAREPSGEVIGWIEGSPVAVKRKLGKGTLIFLGSPLGPVLLSGDREAQVWLRKLLAVR